MNSNRFNANRHATIKSRIDRNGRLRTETTGRDHGLDVAASTDVNNNSTRVFIDLDGRGNFNADLALTGREARTLYRVLHKHFAAQGKSTESV